MLGLGTYDSDEDVEDCKINSTEQSATISSTAKIEAPHSDSELHVHNGRSAIEDSIHSMSSSLDEKNSKSSGLLTMQVELERYVYSHLDELPPSPLQAANPNTIWKISEYLELKELNGFNLTEVRQWRRWSCCSCCNLQHLISQNFNHSDSRKESFTLWGYANSLSFFSILILFVNHRPSATTICIVAKIFLSFYTNCFYSNIYKF